MSSDNGFSFMEVLPSFLLRCNYLIKPETHEGKYEIIISIGINVGLTCDS